MKFRIITEGESEIELDSQVVESVQLAINGKHYEISIKEYADK